MTPMRLDYPPTDIYLHVTSDVERSARINSCSKEIETVEWISSLEPGVFFDLGANVGAYSFVAAACGHKVYAFEPPGPTFDRLELNCDLNPSLEVFAYPSLLGDENALVDFSYSSLDPGAALHEPGSGGAHPTTLRMRTLDVQVTSLNLPYPQYMKIDTDGFELAILRGAEVVLGSGVRSLLVELPSSAPSEIEAFLASQGFHVASRHPHASGVVNTVFERQAEH